MHRIRRFGVGVLLASMVVVAVAGSAGVAHADAWGLVSSRWSGRCFDMRAQDGTGNGVLLQQWDCTGGPEQHFIAWWTDWGYLLVNQRSGRCLRPSGGATWAGSLIEQTDCNIGDPSQHWTGYDPGYNSTGAKWLVNLNSGKCVGDSAWNTNNGVLLTQSDCVYGWFEYWWGL